MTPSPSRRLLFAALVATVLALLALLAVRSERGPRALDRYARGLGPEFRHHLEHDDDAAFAAYCRDLGAERYFHQHRMLLADPVEGVPGAYAALAPYVRRLARVDSTVYDLRLMRSLLRSLDAAPPDVLAEVHRRVVSLDVNATDASLDDSLHVALVEADLAFAARHGQEWRTVAQDARLVRLQAARGRRDAAWFHLRRGLRTARRIDHAFMTCQLLGMASQMHLEDGHPDSARHCLDLAEARARRSRLAAAAGRILSFRAALDRDRERFGAAHLELQEAWTVCEEFHGGGTCLRTILNLADLYELVGSRRPQQRVLAAARTLLGVPPRTHDAAARVTETARLHRLEMRLALADGDTAGALAMAEAFAHVYGRRPYPERRVDFEAARARLLAAVGRRAAAAALLDTLLDAARADRLAGWVSTLEVARAELDLALGDTAAARIRLDRRDRSGAAGVPPALPDTPARAAVLAVRLAASPSSLQQAYAAGLAAFRAAASRGDAGVGSYLHMEAHDALRWTIHEHLADDPALGLDFEIRWRALARPAAAAGCAGCDRDTGCACAPSDPRAFLAAWSRPAGRAPFSVRAARAAAAGGPVHAAFAATPTGVVRWWTDARGTRRDTLAVAGPDLAHAVAALSARLGMPEAAGAPPPVRELRRLGRRLLPPDRLPAGSRLLVSPDGPLASVPFGALDIREDGPYRPLVEDVLVATLRRDAPGARPAAGRPCVVVVDAPLRALVRSAPGLTDLPGIAREGAAVAAAWDGSRVLAGPAATRPAVLEALAGARRVHVAGHVVQDPEVPFLAYLPLAGAPGAPPTDAMLEPRDVLGLDLGGCALVVLSGCSSGSPFVEGTRQAPALGDVFLDAGARCVVQAAWDVDDAATARVMAAFARATVRRTDPWTCAAALREATAPLRRGPDGARHPFAWAPWSVATIDPGFTAWRPPPPPPPAEAGG